MSFDDDYDLSNILIDGEIPLDSPLDLDLTNEEKPTVKRAKPLLKCVVCGDNAFGRRNFHSFHEKKIDQYFRIQFRCCLL